MTDERLFDRHRRSTRSAPATLVRLHDGDEIELRIASVRKQVGDDVLRMLAYNGSIPGPTLHVDQGSRLTVEVRNDGDIEATVHWHGLRLENQYDGVPFETQAPIPVGGRYTPAAHRFPTRASTGITRTSARTTAWSSASTARSSSNPRIPSYWPPADRFFTFTLDDLLVEDGKIAPFLPLRPDLHGHGPLRQRHAHQRRH